MPAVRISSAHGPTEDNPAAELVAYLIFFQLSCLLPHSKSFMESNIQRYY